MKKREFLSAVEHEIDGLKKHATLQELEKLDFYWFDPNKTENCIYGQMTGSCTNERSKELMTLCCEKVLDNSNAAIQLEKTFKNFSHLFFNSNNSKSWYGQNRNLSFLSALEVYISLKGAKNEEIIKYLKGEVKRIRL